MKLKGLTLLLLLLATAGPLSAAKKHIPLDLAVMHNNQGVAYLSKSDLDRAEVEFKTACELDPLYADAFNNLGLIYKYKGQFPLAIAALETSAKLKPKWAAPHSHLGAVYLATGDLDKAIKALIKATNLDKKYADAYFNLGIVYLEKAKKAADPKKDWESAVTAFQQATTIDTRLFHAHLDLADTYRKLGQLEKAILRYRLAIETNPSDPEPWRHLAELYRQTGDETKAKDCDEKVRLLEPKSEDDLIKMGESLISQKRYDEAMQVFQRALKKNPNNAMAHFDIGILFGLQGKHGEAAGAYQSAARLKPDFLPAYFNLGVALKKLGDARGALIAFRQAVAINPNHPQSLFEAAGLETQTRNMRGALAAYCQFLVAAGDRFPEEVKFAKSETDKMGGCRAPEPPPTGPKKEPESGPSRTESPGHSPQ
ncbi:MAG TPA: tetratricopeptide repeat protein [bacterium]|nr:tetratricopeptide repeat protein [bacterium]